MEILLLFFGLCAASEISFYKQPAGLVIRDDLTGYLTGDMVKDIHRMATGNEPQHIFTENGIFTG